VSVLQFIHNNKMKEVTLPLPNLFEIFSRNCTCILVAHICVGYSLVANSEMFFFVLSIT
jgi:hypothetical protein